jgi:hypothetical protein
MHDFFVEWSTAEVVITQVVAMPKKDHFDWWYLYSFKTESGQDAQGKIVLSERDRFSAGDRIPVVYVRSEPQDNQYPNEWSPRGFWYWVLIGSGVLVLSATLRREIDAYRAWRRLARLGYPVPGEVIKAQWVPLVKSPKDPKLDIEYMFSTPGRHNFRAQWQISASDVADKAEPGVIVAVWYSPEEGYLLL